MGGDGTIETIDIVELEKSRGNDIWQTGHIQQYDLSVSGGQDYIKYFLSGNFENSTGVEPDNKVEKYGMRASRVYAQNGDGPTGGTALSIGEEYRNMTFNGDPDPRVTVSDFIRTEADGTDLYYQYKYTSLSDPLPLATGDEAQLIVAEIQGGQTAVDIINNFHSAVGLDPFPGGSAAEIEAQVIEERQRELWLEGHRFFDIRRLDLPLIPAPNTPYRKGGLYGTDRCFPLPAVEIRNNPNIG